MLTSGQHLGAMSQEIAYAVSKGAIHQATASLADDLARRGITVNTVNPGPTDTGWPAPQVHAEVLAQMPRGRWGTPDDAARLIAWLCSDDAELDHRPGDRLRGRLQTVIRATPASTSATIGTTSSVLSRAQKRTSS